MTKSNPHPPVDVGGLAPDERLEKMHRRCIDQPRHAAEDFLYTIDGQEARIAELEQHLSHAGDWIAAYLARALAAESLNRQMAEALEKAGGWFADYERQHRAKGTTEANLKADTNEERAAFCRAALAPREEGTTP